ncbi:2-dehydropantoate 2-reductase [Glaciecola sp. KUL10]|uniref:2-dehydropantoate 2-reductase n=1 Tax=Glaciecola sp. (strain KUL10) TaxID=2161813 RepID=UPI000D78781B|nr:2-dehydropantoate 2-reductase [Glaciecola sp. KUL10]GBL03083.1 2-dehydropantoate 2-reductase [Glaciecola sp. KUL10]
MIEARTSKQKGNVTHLVFGAGLIGSYLAGAFLCKGLLCHIHARAKAKQKLANGITLTDYTGNKAQVNQLSFTNPTLHKEAKEVYDVVWVTVKCTALVDLKTDLARFLHSKSIIICCQNGVEAHLVVKEQFPALTVIRAMVPFNVVSESDGFFHRGSQGSFTLEQIRNENIDIESLAMLIDSDILPTNVTRDMTSLQWAKLQLNLGNAVNALSNVPVKAMLKKRLYRHIISRAMQELLNVTDALQIKLPKVANISNERIPFVLTLPNWLFLILAQKMLEIDPKVRTSMWWDLKEGKQTEIDYLHQKVVEQAELLSIPCPVNKWLVKQIKMRESLQSEHKLLSASDFETEAALFLQTQL